MKNLKQQNWSSSSPLAWISPQSCFPLIDPLGDAANQAGFLGAAKKAEMADVEQIKMIIPFVTYEMSFGQNVCDLVFGILSNNQSRETLWVLDTCLIVGLLHLIIVLITASLVLKHVQHSN